MLRKIIITLFVLGFFLLPCLALAEDRGTLVLTIKDAKGRNPVSTVLITNTTTDVQTSRSVGEGVAPVRIDLPVGSYRMLIATDQQAYDAVPVQLFVITAGQEHTLTVTPSFVSSVYTSGQSSGSGSTNTASPSNTGTGSNTGSGTLSIGKLKFATPAVFSDFGAFGDKFRRLETALPAIFDIVIVASGIIFVILFLVGGIQYLFSAGNEEATGKAKKLLVDAIIGLIIVLAAWAIGTWILANLGVS